MPAKKKPSRAAVKAKLNFVAAAEDNKPTEISVHALSADGEVLETASVDDSGEFSLPANVLEKAHSVKVGPAREDPEKSTTLKKFRARDFAEMVSDRAIVDIAEVAWSPWFEITRCVSGSVRRCWPFGWLVAQKLEYRHTVPISLATVGTESLGEAVGQGLTVESIRHRELASMEVEAILQPWRPWCSPICRGVVEVYRRRCCCQPFVILDPRIDLIIAHLEELVVPFPEPEPLPDPPPFEVLDQVFTSGAEDQLKVNAFRDLAALKSLAAAEQVQYVEARPYLYWPICYCWAPVKVGDGFIDDDGSFEICWNEPLQVLFPGCSERYAYVVKQQIDGTTTTIYDGVSAGNWFTLQEHADLVSYHPEAIACRPAPAIDVPGAYAYLQDIGSSGSYRLATPLQTAPASVGPLQYNSGLLDPAANAAAAVGKLLDRNFGGTLRLRYHFSEPLRAAGGHYYRVSVAEDDGSGAPVPGSWKMLEAREWRYTEWTGVNLVSHKSSLGPHTVGGESNLYEIPYDDALPANEEWQDGQYHAELNTTQFKNQRHLLRIELFDNTGQRIRPTGSTGAGTDAGFKYFRWLKSTGANSFVDVDYGSLTHMLWWDNRPAVAKVRGVRFNGAPANAECLFLEGSPTSNVAVTYHAYHPDGMFLWSYWLRLRRGIGGPYTNVANDGLVNAGQPYPGTPHISLQKNLADLLEVPPSTPSKCSFSITLGVAVKTTNGSGTLAALNRYDTGAFAAEITNP